MKKVKIGDFIIGEGEPLTIMCGPCVIESEEHTLFSAETLKEIFEEAEVQLIFKASYDKANRSSYHGFRGPGLEKGLQILEKVKEKFGLPVVSDIHAPQDAELASKVLDCLQIPAFLCRQTDLIFAAAKTDRPVSVKKGQFMAPLDMKNVVEKIHQAGNEQVILVERGSSFGYNNLVADMRSIPLMQSLGVPVCFDATHAVQLPGGRGDSSGGDREFIPVLAKAALAAGANCLFMEAHPDPKHAKSDSATVLDFKALPRLLRELKALYDLVQNDFGVD